MHSENHFLPPPRPQEQWRDFMRELERDSARCREVTTPQSFLQLISAPHKQLCHLRSFVKPSPTTVSDGLLVGVITRKNHPVFFDKKLSADTRCTVWMRDATDEVRVTFWGGTVVRANYEKLQEGRLLIIKGYKCKEAYKDKIAPYESARLSDAEVTVLQLSVVEVIDLYSVWHSRPSDHSLRKLLTDLCNFEFCPVSLRSLSLSPSPPDYTRSLVARVVYKSAVRSIQSKLGEVPSVWLALYDGSLSGEEEGSLEKEYVWLLLQFSFQSNLFDRLRSNQLIVLTNLKAVYLFHQQWQLVQGYNLVLLSTLSTQVYILDEELPSSAWHYTKSVQSQKADELAARAARLSRLFRDSAPEISQEDNSLLLRQGNFECLI